MSEAFTYCWTDHRNKKLYVGVHKGEESDGYICSSKHMMKEYDQRPSDFTRQIIAHGTYKDMRSLETAILKSANAAINEEFYNMHNGGTEFVCLSHSEETKQKISKSLLGNKFNLGKPASKETREKMRKAKLGSKLSQEARQKIAESNRRRVVTEETKQKIGKANRGKKASKETREKLSKIRTGRQVSLETRQKIAESNRRRVYSEETRRKISESLKKRAAMKKEMA